MDNYNIRRLRTICAAVILLFIWILLIGCEKEEDILCEPCTKYTRLTQDVFNIEEVNSCDEPEGIQVDSTQFGRFKIVTGFYVDCGNIENPPF